MTELPGVAGAVNRSCFAKLARDAVECGERHHHHEGNLPSGESANDDQLREEWIRQPLLRPGEDADVDQDKVHDPLVAVEYPAPQDGHGDPRHQPDLENRGAEETDKANATAEKQGDDKAKDR
jgi:hypothetical protein